MQRPKNYQPATRMSPEELAAVQTRLASNLRLPYPTWGTNARDVLRQIRAGKEPAWTEVEGIRLLDRITIDVKAGGTFFHLGTRARELLRADGRLPWGT